MSFRTSAMGTVLERLGLRSRTRRKGIRPSKPRRHSFEPLERRELLSITLQWDPTHSGGTNLGGSGTWNTTSAQWFDGTQDVAWQPGSDAVFQGAAGTVSISGAVNANSLHFPATAYTIQGGPLSLASGNTSIDVSSGGSATINSILSGSGGLTKTGDGVLTLGGTDTFSGAMQVSGGTLDITAGGVVSGTNFVRASSGGTLTIEGTLTVADNGTFAVGSGVGGVGTVVVNSGAVVNIGNGSGGYAGRTYIGGYLDGAGSSGVGVFTINGGIVNVAAGGPGTAGDAYCLWLNPWGGSGSAVLNLNGGTLSTARLIQDGAGKAGPVHFNGGTLQAAANNMTLINAVTADVDGGGAIIDTNGYNASIGQPFVHGTGTTDGGLTKIGNATLTLAGTNNFNGGTTIDGGTLKLGNASALGSGDLTVDAGTLDLAGYSPTVGALGGTSGTITNSVLSPATLITSIASGSSTFGVFGSSRPRHPRL